MFLKNTADQLTSNEIFDCRFFTCGHNCLQILLYNCSDALLFPHTPNSRDQYIDENAIDDLIPNLEQINII